MKKLKYLFLLLLRKIKDNRLILLIFCLILINSLIWNFTTPIWQTPDEIAHFSYAQGIVEHRHFPSSKNSLIYISKETVLSLPILRFDEIQFNPNEKFLFIEYEKDREELVSIEKYRDVIGIESKSAANYPPFYYSLCSIPYLVFRNQSILTSLHSMRLISTCLLIITCLYIYKVTKILRFNNNMCIAACVFVGFQPMVTMLSASVNPDNLIITLFSIFTYHIVRIIEGVGKPGVKDIYRLISILLLTILTKEYSLVMFGLFFIFLFYYIYQRKKLNDFNIKIYIPFLVLFLLLIVIQYKVLTLDSGINELSLNNLSSIGYYLKFLLSRDYINRLASVTFQSFWGVFGWLDTPMHPQYYDLMWIFILITSISIVLEVFSHRKRLRVFFIMLISLIFTGLFLTYLDFKLNSLDKGMITQGRYYLVSLSPIAVLFCMGWENLRKVFKNQLYFLPSLISFLCIIFNFIALTCYIYPRYYVIC